MSGDGGMGGGGALQPKEDDSTEGLNTAAYSFYTVVVNNSLYCNTSYGARNKKSLLRLKELHSLCQNRISMHGNR